jgi:phage recombination protein Bet
MSNVIAHPTARLPFRIHDDVKRVLRANEYPRGDADDDELLSDQEFDDFMVVCEQRQLDPLHRHIYATKRLNLRHGRKVLSVEATIDGLRLIADRTRRYRGQTRPAWAGPDGRWVDAWLETGPPRAAAAGVWREGDVEPIAAVAHYDEFVQRLNDGNPFQMWSEKPRLMLSKCAEALALRKAFPAELGGLYTAEELDRADPRPASPRTARPAADAVVAGVGDLALACAQHGFSITVAHSLAHLASSGAKIDALLQHQSRRAISWARWLADVGVDEAVVLDAVTYALEHSRGWQAAQANFERWISRKCQNRSARSAPVHELAAARGVVEHVPLQAVVA